MLTKKQSIIFTIILFVPYVIYILKLDLGYNFVNNFIGIYPAISIVGISLILFSYIQQVKTRIIIFSIFTCAPLVFLFQGVLGFLFIFTFFMLSFSIFGGLVVLLSWLKLPKTIIAIIATVLSSIPSLYLYIGWAVFGLGFD